MEVRNDYELIKNNYQKYQPTESLETSFQYYIDNDIITLSDVSTSTENELMNKILKQVHPYKIYQSTSDNRWHTRIKDEKSIRGYREIAKNKEADLLKYLMEHYGIKSNKKFTFESIYDEFMEFKKATQKPGTINMYIKAYQRYYKDDEICKKDLSKIDSIELRIWLCKNIEKYKLSYKPYQQMTVVFNQLYKYAIEKGYVEKNPFDKINTKALGLYNSRKKKSNQKAYTKEEAIAVSKIAYEDFISDPHCTPIAVLLTFQTGMRVGEVVALKWEDIDFESKTIYVRRMENQYQENNSDNRSTGKCCYEIIEGNTKGVFGERIVDLTDESIYILNLLKNYYESINLSTEWLFVYKNGTRIHNRAMESHLKKYCKAIGMPKFKSMHKIRCTYISMLRDSGMSFEKIAEEVGHQSVVTTMNNYSFDVNSDEENKRILNQSLNLLKIS